MGLVQPHLDQGQVPGWLWGVPRRSLCPCSGVQSHGGPCQLCTQPCVRARAIVVLGWRVVQASWGHRSRAPGAEGGGKERQLTVFSPTWT